MFKIYSKGCEYALKALIQIPAGRLNEPFLARDLCRKARVPESSTRKSFQKLVREGILESVPGPGGGYKLVPSSRAISILSIVRAIDGEGIFEKCIMGLPGCDRHKPCPLHNTWKRMKTSMMKEMGDKSLFQLMKAVQ